MSESERKARAAARRQRITATVERRGTRTDSPEESNPSGAAGVELAYRLTLGTYQLLGKPVSRTPRADWPGVVRRPPTS